MHAATLLSAAALLTGSLSGTVTKEGTADPVNNYGVELYDAGMTPISSTCTAPDGSYSFSGLTAGSYYVRFSGTGCAAGTLAPEWWKDRYLAEFADPVTVTDANDTPGIDAVLAEGAQILGRVTDRASGQAVQNVAVEVREVKAGVVGRACTAADGTYTVNGLIPGVMTVAFISDKRCGPVAAYPTQFYLDVDNYPASRAVNLGPSEIAEHIDGHLSLPAAPGPGANTPPGQTTPPPPVTGQSPPPRATAPAVSGLKLSRSGTLSLRVSAAATIKVKVERRAGKRWRAVKRVSSKARRAGTVKVALKLRTSGRYRVTVTATANGLTSRAVRKTARVAVKRK